MGEFNKLINRRIWDKENGVSYFCSICGQYKPEKEFYKRKNSKWNVESRCKIHFTRKDREVEDKETSHLKLQRVTEQDFLSARDLLHLLGYDTSGKESVSEQFNKRHKLK